MSNAREISTEEAARILGPDVSTAYIRLLAIAGKIRGRKLNERAWLIDRRSAETYARDVYSPRQK